MDEQPAATENDPANGPLITRYRRTQMIVVVASVLCFILFWYAGDWLHFPPARGYEASLLRQSIWPIDLFAVYLFFAVAITIGSVVAGRSWFFAGLFAAAVGLAALSARGGPMRSVLFQAATDGSPRGVFLALAFELCLLFLPLALMWVYFSRRYDVAIARLEAGEDKKPSGGSLAMTLLVQFVAMGALLLLLAPTDAKKQVLVGVFLAGFGGTALAENVVPDRKAAPWFWVAPLALGLVGYVFAFINGGDFTTGVANGMFANLAHPLPLDYASAGVAGTLLGYWSGAERPELSPSRVTNLSAENGTAAA